MEINIPRKSGAKEIKDVIREREKESEDYSIDNSKLSQLEERNKELENTNWFNSLSDDKNFRYELLRVIASGLQPLTEIKNMLKELTSE